MNYVKIMEQESNERRFFICHHERRFEDFWKRVVNQLDEIANTTVNNPDDEVVDTVKKCVDTIAQSQNNQSNDLKLDIEILEKMFSDRWTQERLIEMIVFRSLIKLAVAWSMTDDEIQSAYDLLVEHFCKQDTGTLPKTGADYMAEISLILATPKE